MTYKSTLIRLFALVICFAFASCSQPKDTSEGDAEVESTEEESQSEPETAAIASPRQSADGTIGGASVTVDYGSPAVKGREIWGGLEPYGKVWRAGANETTSIQFSAAVKIGDTEVAAGKYGFYVLPNENEEWVLILNSDWDRDEHGAWGAYNYNKENDVVRVQVNPEWEETVEERLSYAVESDGIVLSWEKLRIKLLVSSAAGS